MTKDGSGPASKFTVNLGLLLMASAMAFSGLLIQFEYHMGHHGEIDTNDVVLGMSYFVWSAIHKVSIVAVSFLMIFHVILDWKWYEGIVKKHLLAKNKQVVTLIILFVTVASTGYLPWLIEMAGGSDLTRKLILEIHDKLALVLFVYLILHVTKRFRWFVIAFNRLKKQPGSPIQ